MFFLRSKNIFEYFLNLFLQIIFYTYPGQRAGRRGHGLLKWGGRIVATSAGAPSTRLGLMHIRAFVLN